MPTRRQTVTSAALLLGLACTLAAFPPGRTGAGLRVVGTAQAAPSNVPIAEFHGVITTWLRRETARMPDFDSRPTDIPLPSLRKPSSTNADATRAYRIGRWGEVVGERLLTSDWACPTAELLDRQDTFDSYTKLAVELNATRYYGASYQEAKGFVEQASELGKSFLLQMIKIACQGR